MNFGGKHLESARFLPEKLLGNTHSCLGVLESRGSASNRIWDRCLCQAGLMRLVGLNQEKTTKIMFLTFWRGWMPKTNNEENNCQKHWQGMYFHIITLTHECYYLCLKVVPTTLQVKLQLLP